MLEGVIRCAQCSHLFVAFLTYSWGAQRVTLTTPIAWETSLSPMRCPSPSPATKSSAGPLLQVPPPRSCGVCVAIETTAAMKRGGGEPLSQRDALLVRWDHPPAHRATGSLDRCCGLFPARHLPSTSRDFDPKPIPRSRRQQRVCPPPFVLKLPLFPLLVLLLLRCIPPTEAVMCDGQNGIPLLSATA